HGEHSSLKFRLMNPDAASADFDAVEDDVVSLRAHLAIFACFQQGGVLRFRAGERMMDSVPAILLGTKLKKGKIHDPQELEFFAVGGEILDLGNSETNTPEHFHHVFPLVCAKKDEIAFF